MQNQRPLPGLPDELSYLQSLSRTTTTSLEESIFGNRSAESSVELSPNMDASRRESFAGASNFSPRSAEEWPGNDLAAAMMPNNMLFEQQRRNMAMHPEHDVANSGFNAQAANMWAMRAGVAVASPHHPDAVSPEVDQDPAMFQRFFGAVPTVSQFPQTMFASPTQDGHMGAMAQGDWNRQVQVPNREQQSTAALLNQHNAPRSDMAQNGARGDNVRKRNTRFEIPPEHNLGNIDTLIAQSTDEVRIKELKAQKRLLRNRQAALDSRQRKKMHTERLEDEKKHFNGVLSEMEATNARQKLEIERLTRELQTTNEFYTAQKEEMIRAHTVEARELRKKNIMLTEHIQRIEGNTTAPSSPSNAFNHGDFSDMAMPGNWDNATFTPNAGPGESNSASQERRVVPKSEPMDDDKTSAQGGLLFMLFLVGAFVMSSRSANPVIPRATEEVRQASAALLDTVLRDAGMPPLADAVQPAGVQPSGAAWSSASAGVSSDAPAPFPHADQFGIASTSDASNQQAFGLGPEQYMGMNDQGYLHSLGTQSDAAQGSNNGRKSLAQALDSMQQGNKQGGMAEVYTRSLLWDKVPNDVVRNFAKMFADKAQPTQHHDADSMTDQADIVHFEL